MTVNTKLHASDFNFWGRMKIMTCAAVREFHVLPFIHAERFRQTEPDGFRLDYTLQIQMFYLATHKENLKNTRLFSAISWWQIVTLYACFLSNAKGMSIYN